MGNRHNYCWRSITGISPPPTKQAALWTKSRLCRSIIVHCSGHRHTACHRLFWILGLSLVPLKSSFLRQITAGSLRAPIAWLSAHHRRTVNVLCRLDMTKASSVFVKVQCLELKGTKVFFCDCFLLHIFYLCKKPFTYKPRIRG